MATSIRHRLVGLLISVMMLSSTLSQVPIASAIDDDRGEPSDGGTRSTGDGSGIPEPTPIYEEIREASGDTTFGIFATTAGDLNGDGADDYMNWRLCHNENLYVVYGSRDRDFSNSVKRFTGPHWFLPVGDLNGDGYDDVLQSSEEGSYSPFHNMVSTLPTKVGIRYGSPAGLSSVDSGELSVAPVRSNGSTWDRMTYRDIGDVNGDGYDDIMVIAGMGKWPTPPGPYNRIYHPVEMQLYFGSADGLASAPGWTADLTTDDTNWTAMMVVGHGDFNGDGRSDIVIEFSADWEDTEGSYLFTRSLAIHLGSDSGISLDPDFSLEFAKSEWVYLEAIPARFDGDAMDDLIVIQTNATPQHLLRHPARILVYGGASSVLSDEPVFNLSLDYQFGSQFAELNLDQPHVFNCRFLDINGDGRDDMVNWTIDYLNQSREPGLEDWQYVPHMNIHLQTHLNWVDGLKAEPDAVFSLWNVSPSNDMLASIGVGDFDGDGMEDLAAATGGIQIGTPPYHQNPLLHWPGPLFLFYGSGLTSLVTPLLNERPSRYFAAYKAYGFLLRDDPKDLGASADVMLTLDPGRAGARLRWHREGATSTWSVMNGSDIVSLTSTPADVLVDEVHQVTWLRFRVIFDWDWPHEELCDVGIDYTDGSGRTYGYMMPSVFSVENDIHLSGELVVNGSYQGALFQGQWVKGGEVVDVSGPTVVYQGTTNVHPPAGSCNVSLTDDDGDRVVVPNPGEASLSMCITADAETDQSETLFLGLVDLPGTAEADPSLEFAIRVDADAPRFEGQMPDTSDWLSTNDVLIGIVANDTGTSGIEARTLEYSYCGDGGIVGWSQRGLAMNGAGGLIEASTVLSLPDGSKYWVQWRVKDRVGNGWTLSDRTPLRIDTKNLTFSNPIPDPNVWQNNRTLRCGVMIMDARGSGVDVSTVQYRVSAHNFTGYGPWTAWNAGVEDVQIIEPRVEQLLSEGPYNYIQWRASDVAGNGPVISPHYRVLVDTQPIEFGLFWPTDVQRSSDVEVGTIVYKGILGSDVDPGSCKVRQRSGEGHWSAWAPVNLSSVDGNTYRLGALLRSLAEGTDNFVQFQAIDLARNGPTLSPEYRISVDLSGPVFEVVCPEGILTESTVLIHIRVSDAMAGIDSETISFRYRTSSSEQFSEWSALELWLNGTALEGTVQLTLEPGDKNAIQFTGRDLLGNALTTDPLWIWINRPPRAVIMKPQNGTNQSSDEPMFLSAEGSGDPDGHRITFCWYIDGKPVSDDLEAVLRGPFSPGRYRIELVVSDPLGARGDASVEIEVLEPVQPAAPRTTSMSEWTLPLIVVVLAIVSTALYLRRVIKGR